MAFNKVLAGLVIGGLMCSTQAVAGPITAELGFWATDGWTRFANDDGELSPGVGGQAFDAEYLYYKYSSGILSLGIQTGFNVLTGKQLYSDGKYYYAGDLAVSVDNHVTTGAGAGSTYEYGVDFGLLTKGYYGGQLIDAGSGTGIDDAGLYLVSSWSNDVYTGHHASDPFAIDGGVKVASLLTNQAGYDAGLKTYYRTVSLDVSGLGWGDGFGLDAHWTMSCGNDAIHGHTPVPEPGGMPLLALGLAGLLFGRTRKRA